MNKKAYFITISGETGASTIKNLTEEERQLVSDIFEECESKYVVGYIEELPSDEKIVEMFADYEQNKTNGNYVMSFCEYTKMKGIGEFSPSLYDYMYLRNQFLKP